jgi:hypothetical protein
VRPTPSEPQYHPATNTPLVRRAALTLAISISYIVAGLWADRYVGWNGQLLLGALTTAVLVGLLFFQPPTVRLQTLAVIGFATLGEVIGSLIWGLYTYRLENLPSFVPPGHGIVYLAGLSLATLAGKRSDLLVAAGATGAAVWGIAGLTVLPRTDVAGAIGCAFLVLVLAWTRRPVYAGVFVAVAALEFYGTAIGTWTWQAVVPGFGFGQGNPPSGVASGYVLFDVLALVLTASGGIVASRVWRNALRGSSPDGRRPRSAAAV